MMISYNTIIIITVITIYYTLQFIIWLYNDYDDKIMYHISLR